MPESTSFLLQKPATEISMEDVVAKLPAHMFIRHKTYAVKVSVPTDIQGILDKKRDYSQPENPRSQPSQEKLP